MLFSGEPYTQAQLDLLNNLATQLGTLRQNPSALFVEPTGAKSSPEPSQPPVAVSTSPTTKAASQDDEFTTINLEGDGEILHEFASEAREHLENIEQGILVLEDNPQDATTLSSIFRAFHTFKGASGFLRLQPVNRLSHELENLLDLARSGRLELTPPIIDIILEGKDVLKDFTDELQLQIELKKPVEPIHVPVNDLTRRVKAVIADPSAPVATKENPKESEADEAVSGEGAKKSKNSSAAKNVSQMMKVDTRKFDSLVELVGELVIAQSQVSQHPDLVGLRSQQLARNLLQLSQTALALQKIAMSLRMVAIKGTFQKMNRLVRDLTAKIDKDVELVIKGEDTEMDRTMVEELADPLMHMIRNSVDHGIEPPMSAPLQAKQRRARSVFPHSIRAAAWSSKSQTMARGSTNPAFWPRPWNAGS
jgi:two-component system chemotaxis sensor kinase CheA